MQPLIQPEDQVIVNTPEKLVSCTDYTALIHSPDFPMNNKVSIDKKHSNLAIPEGNA